MTAISQVRINSKPVVDSNPVSILPTGFILSWTPALGSSWLGYQIKIGTSSQSWGQNSFVGDILDTQQVQTSNGSVQHAINFATLLPRGSTLYGQIRLVNGSTQGAWFKFAALIKSLPSVINPLYIDPDNSALASNSIGPLSDLSVAFVTDSVETRVSTQWFCNNVRIASLDDFVYLPNSYIKFGDQWKVKLVPYDSLEQGLPTVMTSLTANVSSSSQVEIKIVPSSPSVDDVLSAVYDSAAIGIAGSNASVFGHKWYVNNAQVFPINSSEYSTSPFARLDVIPGDEVKVEVFAIVNGVETLSHFSNNIVVVESSRTLQPISVDGKGPDSIVLSDSPSVSWNNLLSFDGASSASVKVDVGFVPGSGSLFSGSAPYSLGILQIPDGILSPGLTYYASVSLADNAAGNPIDSIRFTVPGHAWKNNVDNTVGWKLGLELKLNKDAETGPSILYPYVLDMSDGSVFVSLDIGVTGLRLRYGSEVVFTINKDMKVNQNLEVSCKLRRMIISIDSVSVFDGQLPNSSVIASEKFVQIAPKSRSATNYNLVIANILYSSTFDVSSVVAPSIEGRIPLSDVSHISASQQGFSVIGKAGGSESDSVFYIEPVKGFRRYECSRAQPVQKGIYQIESDYRNNYAIVAHPFGASIISGCEPDQWTSQASLGSSSSLLSSGFLSFSSHGLAPFQFVDNTLLFDTTFGNSAVATKASASIPGTVAAVKIDSRIGINIYNFQVSSSIFTATVETDFSGDFIEQFSINLTGLSFADFVQQLLSVNIAIPGSTSPIYFSYYYNVIIYSGMESALASLVGNTAASANTPYILSTVSLAQADDPMGSTSGRKAYIETVAGSNPWTQANLVNEGYTIDCRFSVEKIEESLSPDQDLERGLGLFVFDGNGSYNLNFETGVALIEGSPLFSVNEQDIFDLRLVGFPEYSEIYYKRSDESNWSDGIKISPSKELLISGSSVAPMIVFEPLGAHGVAIWHNDDGGSSKTCWLSFWKSNYGWSSPFKLNGFVSASSPHIIHNSGYKYSILLHAQNEESFGIFHIDIDIENNYPVFSKPSRIAIAKNFESQIVGCFDDAKQMLHAIWSDTKTGSQELYHAYLANGEGWSSGTIDGVQITSFDQFVSDPCCVCVSGVIYLGYVLNLGDVERSSIIKYQKYLGNAGQPRWDSAEDVSSSLQTNPKRPSVWSLPSGTIHFVFDALVNEGLVRNIYHRAMSATQVGSITKITNSSTYDCTHPSIGGDSSHLYVSYSRVSNSISAQGRPQSQSNGIDSIYFTYRNAPTALLGTWNTFVNHHLLVPYRIRRCAKSYICKQNLGKVRFVYEAIPAENEEIYNKSNILASAAYGEISPADLISNSSVFVDLGSASDSVDDAVLCTPSAPYIKFGDISSFRSGKFTLYKLDISIGSRCTPRAIKLLSSATGSIRPKLPTDLSIGSSGDAFVVTDGDLFHYDWQDNIVYNMSTDSAAELTKLPTTVDISQIAFDVDGNIIVTAADGSVYVSFDLFRFVKFNFGVNVTSVGRDGIALVFASATTLYRIENWREYVARIPTTTTTATISIDDYDVEEIASVSGLKLTNSQSFGLIGFGSSGIYRVNSENIIYLGSRSDLLEQPVLSFIEGPDGNAYCTTGFGVFRLDGTRWTLLKITNPSGVGASLGRVTSLGVLQDHLLIGCENGVFETSVSGNTLVGSLIPNATLYSGINPSSSTDLQSFKFRLPSGSVIDKDTVVQAFVNGYPVSIGFGISAPDANGERSVQFACPMLASDNVSVAIRDDMRLVRNLKPNPTEVLIANALSRTIEAAADGATSFFAASKLGSRNVVKISQVASLPSDEVILDTLPPRGKLRFVRQVGANEVTLSIDRLNNGAEVITYDATSGVDKYVVSNYTNFTSDGVTPLPELPFATQFNHNLLNLSSLSPIVYEEEDATDISSYLSFKRNTTSDPVELLFTSTPAGCRRRQQNESGGSSFSEIFVIGSDALQSKIVDVVSYNGYVYVASVSNSSNRDVQIYRSDTGSSWELFASLNALQFGGFLVSSFDNALYMLTSNDVRLYKYTGSGIPLNPIPMITTEASSVTGFDRYIHFASGSDKRVYRIDLGSDPNVISIVHYDADELTDSAAVGTNVYVGTKNSGRILRSADEDEPFLDSFKSSLGKVAALFTGKVVVSETSGQTKDFVFAAVGKNIYRYSNGWVYSGKADADIVGISQNAAREILFWTRTSLFSINLGSITRRVYLQLRDKAGNVTSLTSVQDSAEGFNETPDQNNDGLNDNLVLDIDSAALRSLTISGQLIEFDTVGNTSVVLGNGDSPFFSADRVRRESAIIETEILNASDGHITWGKMKWTVNTPPATAIFFQVRTGVTRTECEQAEYGSPIPSTVNEYELAGLPGQFIQVKIILISSDRQQNPSISQLLIESILSTSSQLITTVFLLPSPPKRGMISLDKMVPVSARIVPCLDTLDRVEISDFQEIPENRLFSVDSNQFGNKLRLGFKFFTPSIPALPGSTGNNPSVYTNVVTWEMVNETSTDDILDFKVSFFEDSARTVLKASSDSISTPQYFLYDGLPFPSGGGATVPAGGSARFSMIPYAYELVSGITYYARIYALRNGVETILANLDKPYERTSSAAFFDTVAFEFSATTTDFYDFKIEFFEDEALTRLAPNGSYFSFADADGWRIDDQPWPAGSSPSFEANVPRTVAFSPSTGALELNKIYYLKITSFDGSVFSLAYIGLTFMAVSQSGFVCGDQQNVPILKGFSIMFELEGGQLIKFNTII